jgi:hypothetical protein
MRELNVDVGFEAKKMKVKGHGRLYISLDKKSSANLLISVIHFSIFFWGCLPLPRKRSHIEEYYPFPRYKIKPTNGSEYTKFHFDSHYLLTPSKQM